MAKPVLPILLLLALGQLSCQEQAPSNREPAAVPAGTELPESGPPAQPQPAVTPSPAAAPAAEQPLARYAAQLQGSWKRQAYPFDVIEFKGQQVNFRNQEGRAEPSAFKDFVLTAACEQPGSTSAPPPPSMFGILTDQKNCQPARLTGNTLTLFYGQPAEGVAYQKQTSAPAGTPAASSPPPATAEKRVLPLEPGFYVLLDAGCDNPPNAAWRYWDGVGLRGSSTTACTLRLVARQGARYTLAQTCVNTYDKSTTQTPLTVLIDDVNHFTLTESGRTQRFQYCPTTPSWLPK